MRFVSRLRHESRGSAMIELAIALPFLIMLIVGAIDVGRFFILQQKLQRLSSAMADLVSQGRSISNADLQQISEITDSVMWPFDFASYGKVVISGLGASGGSGAKINWQAQGSGSLGQSSRLGNQGGTAHVPQGFSLQGSDTAIAAEVFYDFRPVFNMLLDPELLYHAKFFRPRLDSLNSLS